MSSIEGILSQISIAKESAYGTPVTPTISLPVKESDGIQTNQDVVAIEAIKGTAPKNKGFFKGKRTYEGGFDTDLYPQNLGLIFLSTLGAVQTAVANGETIVYNHTFTETVAKKSLTVEQKIGSLTKRFAGFIVKSIKMAGKVGETISLSFEGIGKTSADATAITASYETTRPFNFNDVASLKIATVDYKAFIEDFELTYDNNLDVFHSMGAVDASVPYVKPSEVKGKFTLYLDSTTDDLLTQFEAVTEGAIELTLTGDAVGSASHYGLVLTLPKCAIKKFETKLSFGYNAISLEFEAREDSASGLIQIVVTNTVTSL